MKATEKNFIKLIEQGKEEGLLYVVDAYGWIIQTVVRKQLFMLPDLQDECVNDVLLAVWEHIKDYHPELGTFQNWIAGITRFKAIDCKRNYIKHQARCQTLEHQELEDCGAKDQMLRMELKEEIEELLCQLSKSEQEIFRKYFVEETSIEEISEGMNLKKDTIYQRISRGRRKLQKYRELRGGER